MLTFPSLSLWDELAATSLPLVLYGMGDGADKIRSVLSTQGLSISAVFASDDFYRPGKTYAGLPIETLAQVEARLGDFIILVAFGSHLPELHQRIENLARRHPLRIPDVPVAGDTLFDTDFGKAHEKELQKVYDLLADEPSRRLFQSVINYKITGRPEYLFADESTESEGWDLLELTDREHYLDLGAYRGDTVDKFLVKTQDYESITALEPAASAYGHLVDNHGDKPRTVLLNEAIGATEQEVHFSQNRGRGSHVSANGRTIAQTTVDALAKRLGHGFTYIKVDVEGAEKEVLLGASETLEAGPKLNLALYHRSEDLYELPLLLQNLYPNYEMKLRRHPCFPCWDLNLYCKPFLN